MTEHVLFLLVGLLWILVARAALQSQIARVKPNRTRSGALACFAGTPWLDHFKPPTGTGKGCPFCAGEKGR